MKITTSWPHLSRGLGPEERKQLQPVHEYAQKHLSAIPRRSGESYAQHGEEVALVLRESGGDVSLLRVAILHDLLIHSEGAALLKSAPLTDTEKTLAERMHDLRRLHIDKDTRDLDQVIESFLEDARLLPLRMAHRVNDVRHLRRFASPLARQIAEETLHMYTSIAGRMSMNMWRYEMEDICFRKLQPAIAGKLENQYERMQELDDACLRHSKTFLARKLREQGIVCTLEHRKKALYSTYRKMVLKKRTFEELTDRLALRIVVEQPMDCYRALAVVHALFHPIPGKLKDYIGAPKENGYQSIHTVVYPLPGVTEQPMEIQIRTSEMHRLSRFGVASHGEYKKANYALSARPARVDLFRNLGHLREEARSPEQFEAALRKYFSEDHIAVFDTENNLYHFKKPITALDFSFHLHPKRFARIKEVKINGRRNGLDAELRDGDTVEVFFCRENRLHDRWVDACANQVTKRTIRRALRTSSQAESKLSSAK